MSTVAAGWDDLVARTRLAPPTFEGLAVQGMIALGSLGRLVADRRRDALSETEEVISTARLLHLVAVSLMIKSDLDPALALELPDGRGPRGVRGPRDSSG